MACATVGKHTSEMTQRVKTKRIASLVRQLLLAIGENPERDGLKDTPRRVANFWKEFVEYDPGKIETGFEFEGAGQIVVVKDIKAFSLCEHHMLPFSLSVTIAYKPAGRIIGLSKFARLVGKYSHALQVQERFTQQVADEVERLADVEDVAVLASGRHMCMEMRGIRNGAPMLTAVRKGLFAQPSEPQSLLDLLLK